MVSRRVSAAVSPDLPRPGDSGELKAITSQGPEDSFIPNVKTLNEISGKISALAQTMMRMTYQRPEGFTLVEANDLLVEGGAQLATIERLAAGDQRVGASLEGIKTALLTAVRELREHLIRHGWVVDDIAQWQAAATLVRDGARLSETERPRASAR